MHMLDAGLGEADFLDAVVQVGNGLGNKRFSEERWISR